ncbi:NADP-dependent oxidoreductase [uncultured Arthrobacter sp.]|uniref:NADP-dependent oxidoreductase n=1 Tax=uncultured Arthrobacter sp. TaxID=114050 RepID=UPI0025FAE44B|nr:NADP-dependent oxidoreductase [uncultured Arthrobacter sp.]
MSKSVIVEAFGGPDVLHVREVPAPHAGTGQLRIKTAAAGLNPMDWLIIADDALGAEFGVHPPTGFGYDFAGVVDEVGDSVTGFKVGDRVFGGAMSRAAAEFILADPATDEVRHLPDSLDFVTASTLPVAARTAAAVIDTMGITHGDTVLVGGAAGGVGVLTVQLAQLAGARVIGTGSQDSFEFLLGLGVEPVQYGPGLIDRVRAIAPGGISAAADLFGSETAHVALALGVPGSRVATIATQDPGLAATKTGAANSAADALTTIAALVADGTLTVSIAAQYPLRDIRSAVTRQASRHLRGKIVLTV